MKICKNLLLIIMFFLGVSSLVTCNPDVNPESSDQEILDRMASESTLKMRFGEDTFVTVGKPVEIRLALDADPQYSSGFSILLKYDPIYFSFENQNCRKPIFSAVDELEAHSDTPGFLTISGRFTGRPQDSSFSIAEFFLRPLLSGPSELSVVEAFVDTTFNQRVKIRRYTGLLLGVKESSTFGAVSGTVVDSVGGGIVDGASVLLEPLGWDVLSDESGHFSFADVPQGIYEVLVNKSGYAGSRLQRVSVVNGPAEGIMVFLPKYDSSAGAVEPPRIGFKGLEAFQGVSGMMKIESRGIAGSRPLVGTEFHRSMNLKISMSVVDYYQEEYSDNDELFALWNTAMFPSGEAFLSLVAYDNNNNRSELNLPVVIANDSSGEPPAIVPQDEYYQIVANTYGETMNIMRSLQPPSSKAPAGNTIVVDFYSRKYFNGFVVFKSHEPETDSFQLLGQSSLTNSGDFRFVDYAPDLTPGEYVYYRLAYFNRYGIGPLTPVRRVMILPAYRIYLKEPVNESIITDKAPILRWESTYPVDGPAAERTDMIKVTNALDATIIAYVFKTNSHSVEYQLQPLIYNNIYEWDINSLYELQNYEDTSNILSRSFPRGRGATDLSTNGAFSFTVVEAE